MSCASSGHITKLKQSIFAPFDIYGYVPLISLSFLDVYGHDASGLPEQDIVSSLDPCMTPSQVWIPSEDLTGIVPSPDSILVRSWPRALRFG